MLFKKLSVTILIVAASIGSAAQTTPNVQQVIAAPASANRPITLPNAPCSVKFMAVGDTGRGTPVQYQLGTMMANYHDSFKFDMAILTGDNMYYDQKPEDYVKKFELPYKALLDRQVKFYGSLGNHDEPNQVNYKYFNMDGKEYYRFQKGDISFYALNTVYLDKKQIDWFVSEIEKDRSKWKVAFFHHPLYSSAGRHGSDKKVREALEPLFVKYGLDVVFAGHDHTYERVKPQQGIQHFVTGAGGEVRKGDLKDRSTITAKGFDTDLSFMIVEVIGDEMHFQVISRSGVTVDSGVIPNRVMNEEPMLAVAAAAAGATTDSMVSRADPCVTPAAEASSADVPSTKTATPVPTPTSAVPASTPMPSPAPRPTPSFE